MNIKEKDKVRPSQEDDFYLQAENWNEEKYRLAKKSSERWRILSFIFATITILSVIGLVSLIPLKKAVPYVIKVDQSTGIVEIIEPLEQGEVPQDEALTKYFIVKYLNAREQYDFQRAEKDYVVVSKMSSSRVFQQYASEFNPTNENSPLNIYADNATVTIHIRDVIFLDSDTAIIHIKRSVNKFDEKKESYWVISLSFQYVLNPKSESDRFINPLGFQVTSYRIDPEVIEE